MAVLSRTFTFLNDFAIGFFVIGVLIIMIIPLPTQALDVLLTFNIAFSLIILITIIYLEEALDFSIFPSLLLITTLGRLALNIATTRSILLRADAGKVIHTFGNFVVGGNMVVGLVIFLVFIIIQFVVITKGATRVAEVSARFTLDAMPGKQMSIDADLQAGIIDEKEARGRREKISQEAEFYGAMDGASKFVRGDAVAGILITLINILAGLVLGMVQLQMSFGEAGRMYSLLTIGDGLVSQVPALIISVASGLLVTKASAKEHLGQQLNRQIFNQPKTLYFTAGVLFLFAFIGMPPVPFIGSSLMLAGLGYVLQKKVVERLTPQLEAAEPEEEGPPSEAEELEEVLTIDPIRIELGYGLIFLVEGGTEGDLLERVALIRKQLAMDLGMIIPMVRIRDNIQQKPNEYMIKIRGVEIGKGEILPNHYLAMNPGTVIQEMEGIETQEPAFGLPALWIPSDQREVAEMNGYTVVEPAAVLATHLTEILKSSCAELLNRQEVENLVNRIKEKNATLVNELLPAQISYGMLQKVLQKLLSERVSIRDLETILETLGDYIGLTKEVDILVEYCRQSLARTICAQFQDEQGTMHVLVLDAQIEKQIAESIQKTVSGIRITLNPNAIQQIINVVSQELEKALQIVDQPLILTSSAVRPYFRKVIENTFPTIPVVSYEEIVSGIDVKSLGTIRL